MNDLGVNFPYWFLTLFSWCPSLPGVCVWCVCPLAHVSYTHTPSPWAGCYIEAKLNTQRCLGSLCCLLGWSGSAASLSFSSACLLSRLVLRLSGRRPSCFLLSGFPGVVLFSLLLVSLALFPCCDFLSYLRFSCCCPSRFAAAACVLCIFLFLPTSCLRPRAFLSSYDGRLLFVLVAVVVAFLKAVSALMIWFSPSRSLFSHIDPFVLVWRLLLFNLPPCPDFTGIHMTQLSMSVKDVGSRSFLRSRGTTTYEAEAGQQFPFSENQSLKPVMEVLDSWTTLVVCVSATRWGAEDD